MSVKRARGKVLSLLLVLCMIVGLIPSTAIAAQDTSKTSTTENVGKIKRYAEQLRNANQKTDYSTGKFSWDTEGKSDSWRYFNGVMMDAFLMEGDTAYADAFYNSNINDDGTIKNYIVGEVDSIPTARGLFDLLDSSENVEKYKKAIQYVYTQLEGQITYENCGGNYLHKQDTNGNPTSGWSTWNIGLDGLYMAEPFLMECANAIDAGKLSLKDKSENVVSSTDIYREVYARFEWVAETMYDEASGLYHHGWNVSANNGNGHFWGRGIGWYAVALVDTIEMMPDGDMKNSLIDKLPKLFDGMMQYQDAETGMWYNVVNCDTGLSKNILETSVSSMMAYSLMKAYNNGYVTDSKYGQAGLAAFNGVVTNKLQGSEGSYKVVDTYLKSGVGTTDSYYTTNGYTVDEAKGTGALIMAATVANDTAKKLNGGTEPEQPTVPEGLTDETTNITVSGSGATAMMVTDKSDAENVKAALNEKLETGFKAYDITLTGYIQGTEAIVAIPAPEGTDKAYYVSDDGQTVEEVSGYYVDEKYTFTTKHFSTYAVGKAKVADAETETSVTASGELPGGTSYVLDTDGVDDGTYLIASAKSGTAYALRNNGSSASQSISISGNTAVISENENTSTWTFTKSNNSWQVKNGNTYLRLDKSILGTDSRNLTVTDSGNGAYRITYDSRDLRYNSGSWTRGKSEDEYYVYLFKQTTGVADRVNLSVSPASTSLKVGLEQTLNSIVTLDSGADVRSCDISWRSDNNEVATVDSTGKVTGVGAGEAKITATLNKVNNSDLVSPIEVEISVTVTAEPVNVQDIYDSLQSGGKVADPDKMPEYPADGAVRIDKTATGQDFASTGVVKVELDTAGISVKQGVDVVLVVDVSNSMGWSDNWFEGMTASEVAAAKDNVKIPNGTAAETTDKLDQAMAAAQDFSNILLEGNVAGSSSNNSLSFVTFAGFDKDNTNETGDRANYVDSVKTVFTNVQNAASANIAFENTKFTNYTVNGTSVAFDLQIGNTNGGVLASGANRGNTNYDYAFAQANAAVNELKQSYGGAEAYEATGRETVIVFMTDGAPSHYNDNRLNGSHNDTKYGTNNTYEAVGAYNGNSEDSADTWLVYIKNPNKYAQELKNNVDDFYAVGFDLNHGGFGNYSWTQDELQSVLQGVAGENSVEVELTENGASLKAFYNSLANKIKLAGTYARTTDIVDSNFTLQMTQNTGTGEMQGDLGFAPIIEVKSYDLYSKTDTIEDSLIGTRKDEGTVLETVKFSADGTAAYSDQIGETENIMTSAVDGSVTINAKYFVYTKDASGVEKFVWNIGDITDKEVALSYYAYLKNSMGENGGCDKGVYYTNQEAVLEYVDINGDYATQTFRKPGVVWGGAATSFEYYLVNAEGKPVNKAGQEIPFANRIVLHGDTIALNLNQDLTVPAQRIDAAEYLPEGYFLYDVNASYTVSTASSSTLKKGITVSDPSEDARKTVNGIQQSGAQTTIVVSPEDTPEETYVQSRVAFGIRYDLTPLPAIFKLTPDQIVIDYGKDIQVDILANDANITTDYSAELVGFTAYNANTNLDNVQFSAGTPEYTSKNGTYTITSEGKVDFKLNTMLSTVEKVFSVVKLTKKADSTDFFYLYEELDIIPATNVYYETDFAPDIFSTYTTGEDWTIAIVEGDTKADNLQDDGTIGINQTYGFDNSYTDDKYLSNGSSLKVIGQGIKLNENTVNYTQVQFSFSGTGFDLISRTGEQQGAIRVDIYSDSTRTTKVKSVTVLNKSESKLELYQIPVVSVNDLTYGTYYVTIGVNAAYTNTTYPELSRGGEFYFDAIRIYEPAKGNSEAEAAYVVDGESNPIITEVRAQLIAAGDYGEDIAAEYVNGMSFIDQTQNGADIATYTTIGPNNEVYLSEGQGIAFEITSTGDLASIDIGVKAPNASTGKVPQMTANISATTDESGTGINKTITSATPQYYDLMEDANTDLKTIFVNGKAYVVITNAGEGILSITDIKIAYGNVPGTVSYRVSRSAIDYANTVINANGTAEANYDIQSAEFTSSTCKLLRKATMTVVTSADVETLEVLTNWGTDANPTITSEINEAGEKVWTVSMTMYVLGNKTYIVTGYGVDGTAGMSATASIKVKLF